MREIPTKKRGAVLRAALKGQRPARAYDGARAARTPSSSPMMISPGLTTAPPMVMARPTNANEVHTQAEQPTRNTLGELIFLLVGINTMLR